MADRRQDRMSRCRFGASALSVLLCLCIWSGQGAGAEDAEPEEAEIPSERVSEPASASGFERFDLVLQRNIFDPARRPVRPASEEREGPPPPPPQQRIALVGVYLDQHQTLALFDGTSSEHRCTRTVGEEIAGFELAGITTEKVTLRKDGSEMDVRVGGGLRRELEGEWEVTTDVTASSGRSFAPAAGASPESGGPSGTSGSTDADRLQLLRKLMENRQKEVGQ